MLFARPPPPLLPLPPFFRLMRWNVDHNLYGHFMGRGRRRRRRRRKETAAGGCGWAREDAFPPLSTKKKEGRP